MKFILGQKKEMTQIFKEDGSVVPVTVVKAPLNVVTQVKDAKKDGYVAVQVGSGVLKKSHNKTQLGHLKDLKQSRWLREFRFTETAEDKENSTDKFKRGLEFGVNIFRPGDHVRVVGESKGRGFQGVVKRHGFKGAPKTHGTKDQVRMPGSIGATGPAHVFKGMKMGGRMGTDRVTVKGLQVIKVDTENELLYIKGAIPGSYNSLVVVSGPGSFKVKNEKVEAKGDSEKIKNEEEAGDKEIKNEEQDNEQELVNNEQENKEETAKDSEITNQEVDIKTKNNEIKETVKNDSEENSKEK